ncbi:MAG: hypothetical protein Q9M27_03950 [Mariprofundaceae bacterium]|nr:hypothetical protein [Mariprofundaceae bacterium]
MLLEPQGKYKVRNIRVNIAGLIALILAISLGSAALVWYYTPPRTGILSARYYQIQQKNQDLRDRLATLDGEFSLLKSQVDALKGELLASQHGTETLQHKMNVYESILEARKSGGVRILRATARMQNDNTLNYKIILVKGGNYPRSVSGSIRIAALGSEGQEQLLNLGKNTAELPYSMDTHAFLEGDIPWQQEWQPAELHIIRFNAQGIRRDEMEIKLDAPTQSVQALRTKRKVEK